MLQLENPTPLKASLGLFPDPDGIDTLHVAVKATFRLDVPNALAEEQVSVVLADEYHGDPGATSLARAGEVHLKKRATDVLLLGEVWAPGGRPVPWLDCSLRVGKLAKTVRVFGERSWRSGFFSTIPGSPEPFAHLPLVWERAFGGQHALQDGGKVLWESRNPVGCGFAGKRRGRELRALPVPNLEDPQHLLERAGRTPPPAGFAPLSPWWTPRKEHAGTYDQAWLEKRAPYLPSDFDPRFFQLAPPGLVADGYLRGGEPVELLHLSRRGDLRFDLPRGAPRVSVRLAGQDLTPPLDLETVQFEPEEERFTLLWRAALPCDKQALRVERVRIEANGLGVRT